MSYIDGTPLGNLIDRCADGWANILGFTQKGKNTKKKIVVKKKVVRKKKVGKTNE
tara:strand:+ start:877 stop:1041 length:165 start_codon:yes stop_codon:yes gene_type:complete